jgi:hypothetical protein
MKKMLIADVSSIFVTCCCEGKEMLERTFSHEHLREKRRREEKGGKKHCERKEPHTIDNESSFPSRMA